MKLPVIEHPLYDVVMPSSKKKTKIRPMLVKEEKILLMGRESNNPYDIFVSIMQVVNNCLGTADVKAETMSLFDLEYIFLKIRSISVGSQINVTYTDDEDGKEYPFEIDIEKVEIRWPEGSKELKVATGTDKGFVLKYPVAALYTTDVFMSGTATEAEMVDELILHAIESYFDAEAVYKMADNKKEDVKAFIDNLDIGSYNKIRDFVSNLPSLYYEIKYTNSKGTEKSIKLTTLTDFFMLR